MITSRTSWIPDLILFLPLQVVLDEAYTLGTEKIPLRESLDRVLAEDVVSDMDMPPFDKSAMDGFACRRDDLEQELRVIETVAAGGTPVKAVTEGECTRIMTGARVPDGADCVIKVEETDSLPGDKVIFTAGKTKDNIAHKAEDINKDDVVLKAGTRISPHHIAVMASAGWTVPQMFIRPSVGIISTGDEIVEPDLIPGPAQIRNSNGIQLYTQVLRQGSVPHYMGIAADNEEKTFEMISQAMHDHDVVLLSGGVSMGDFDFIPVVFRRLNLDVKFETLAVQPGKPTVFAVSGNKKLVFGLPGNPVSSYNIFELFARPLLNKMMGESVPFRNTRLRMGASYSRKRSSRLSWIPVRISDDGLVYPLEYHGSAHISSLTAADGFAAVPIGVLELNQGDYADIRQI